MVNQCFICSGKYNHYMTGKDYNSNVTDKEFNLYKCENCGVEIILPLPTYEEIKDFYPKTYYSYNIKNQKESIFDKLINLGFKNSFFGGILDRWKMGIPFIIKGKKFLDIGCGDGAIIDLVRKQGWDAYGFEIGGKNYVDNVYFDNDFINVNFQNTKFDFIRISHVFEHLNNPIEFLEKLKTVSHSDTIIDITLPNTKSFDAYCFGIYWTNRDIPRHIINYNINNLEILLKNNGYEVIKKKFLLGFGFGGSVRNLFKYKFGDKFFYKIFQNRFVGLFMLFLDFILSLFYLGDHMGFRIKIK